MSLWSIRAGWPGGMLSHSVSMFAEAIEPMLTLRESMPPAQADQIDAADGLSVRARPVVGDQGGVPGGEVVERRVVEDQDALVLDDEGFGLLPEGLGVGLEAVQEPGEGIMVRCDGRFGWHARGLRAADSSLRGDEEIDGGLISAAGCVHAPRIGAVNAEAN